MNRVGKGAVLEAPEGRFEVSILLFADDAVLVAETAEKLDGLVGKSERECLEKSLKINPSNSKVMWIRGNNDDEGIKGRWEGVKAGGVTLERVKSFRYLGADFSV